VGFVFLLPWAGSGMDLESTNGSLHNCGGRVCGKVFTRCGILVSFRRQGVSPTGFPPL
jgi:hypothetical protein